MILRPFRPGDEVRLNRTFNEVFGQHRSLDEWYWKFGKTAEPKYIMLAWNEDGEILAQWAGVPVGFWAWGQELAAAQIVDVFSRKIARTSLFAAGAYLRAMREFHRLWCGPGGFSLLYGFPSQRPLQLDQRSGEYTQIPPIAVPVFSRLLARKPRLFLPVGLRYGFDPEAADWLWAATRERLSLAVVRDADYFRRRYRRRPGVTYHHLVLRRKGRPAAYGVFVCHERRVFWAELLWDGASRDAVELIVEEGERIGRERGCTEISGWLRGDAELSLLLRNGGWTEAEHPDVRWLGRSFDPRIPPDQLPGSLYFTMGDSDLV